MTNNTQPQTQQSGGDELTALEQVDGCVKLLIKYLCVDTNATKATYTVQGFYDKKSGTTYGDYELTIVKKEPKPQAGEGGEV